MERPIFVGKYLVEEMHNEGWDCYATKLPLEKFDNESCRDYLLRSCDEALNFVTNYPKYTNDVYFDLVI